MERNEDCFFTFRLDRRNVFEMYFIFREVGLEVNMR